MSAMIGVLVRARHQETFRRATRAVSGADLHWQAYQHPAQAPDRLRELLSSARLDGLLLDPQAAEDLREQGTDDLPVTVVRPAAAELAIALAQVRAACPAPPAISVDGFERADVDEVVTALGSPPVTLLDDPDASLEQLLAQHRKTLRAGGIAVSACPEAAEQLRADGPIVTAEISAASIRGGLDELVLRVESERAEARRFAAGVFQVCGGDNPETARTGLRELLLHEPALSGAWVEQHGRRGLVVFAHQALLQRATDDWQVVPVLREVKERYGIRAVAGFGIGPSVRSGISLAERAATRAEAEDEPCGFLIQDSGVIIGPIDGGHRCTAFSYRDHGEQLERLAAAIGLSPTTVSRLVALESEVDGRAVTPSELASLMGITDPSGRRLIRKLQAADLATAEGSAQPNRRGRPTRLYRLHLGKSLS